MNHVRRLALVVAVSALIVTGCSGNSPHRDGARTYYESLDLASPTSAVETFSDAFAGDDFMTVWLAFGRHAQVGLQRDLDLLQYGRVVGPEAMDDLRDWLQNEFSFETMEAVDQWWFFDQIMLIADANDAFLIDLSGNLTIGSEEISDDTAVIFAEVSGIAGEIEFHLRESATGRWQVEQVIVSESDEGPISWPAPPGSN